MPDARLTDPEALKRNVIAYRQMSAFVQDPLIIERGEGVYLWDIHGKRYLDALAGIFVVAVGHRNRRVLDAMQAQMERLCFAPMFHGTNPPAIQLANLLADLAPGDLDCVMLHSSGSETTEAAMKLCRQYWKQAGSPTKYKVISRYYGYHGATLGAMAASGTPRRRTPYEPMPAGFVRVPTVHCYRCPFGRDYPECGVFCAQHIRQVIELEGPETVSALIVEPIGNTGGILTPPPEYLPMLRQICDDLGVLLILDEMITGMGRTGAMFAAETYGVTPDVLCLGKGLASGYAPLAAAIWSARLQEAFWGAEEAGIEFGHGQTYGGNPLSAAAGIASVREILDRDLIGNARRMGARLEQRLRAMDRHGIMGDIRGKGLLWGVELVQDIAAKTPFPAELRIGKRIGAEAQARGMIIRHDPDWFAIAPPLTVTEGEIDEICDLLAASIDAVMARL